MPKRKKILYIVTKSLWGGAQRYVYDLAAHLPKERFEAVVAAGGSGPLFAKLNTLGIRTIAIPAFERDIGIVREVRAFFQLLRMFLREKPDVVHLNSPKAGGLGAVAAFLYKTLYPTPSTLTPRTIFTVHGWPFNEPRPQWQKMLMYFFSWLGALFQNRVILLNQADFETALRFIPKRKCVLIPNGISIPDFLPRTEARRILSERIGRPISDDTILIGTIAELTKNKGITYLIDAINQMRNKKQELRIKVTIVGDGELREELKEKIKHLRLEDSILLSGFIPDASRHLTAFDLFVLPSLKEGLPYSIMEAMAAGLPIVATRVGGIPDMITDGREGVLVEPRNAHSLAYAVGRLIQNPDLRRALGSAARARAARDLSLPRMVERTMTLYDTH